MERTEITAAVITEVDRLLGQGIDHATIAARLGVTEYVVGVIANDANRPEDPPRPPKRVSHRVRNAQSGVDATTIRMIERMLQVGMLRNRHNGVSP